MVANYIKGDGAEILGAFEAAGLGRDALGELIGQIEANAEALAFNELSPEDFEYLTWASEANPEIRELIALQGWKASRGTASMSWPEFARRVRAKLSRA
ncbi:hypothetical protein CEW89_17915 [Celeribacter ethanolicus]|uniref:Uncharacterized protein n=1 Tax=Celeribacter ethanolicus TaxID=1758178 RepID=A0A291GGH7_9RHOB|nr:hypothetical protein CEW89_17915 [Celeribacter ethanolicus]